METLVPPLVPLPISAGMRALSLIAPSVRSVMSQIGPFTAWWDAHNRESALMDGPLLVAIGDSTAIGIGADEPGQSYVGNLVARLRHHDQQPWRVINLALSGAKIRDALDRQIPVLNTLDADRVVCCIGSNDVVWGRVGSESSMLGPELSELVHALPLSTLMATVAGRSSRARFANETLANELETLGTEPVDVWSVPGPAIRERIAIDRFHPNAIGYDLMARAFAERLSIPT